MVIQDDEWKLCYNGDRIQDRPQTFQYHTAVMFEAFQGGPKLGQHDAETRKLLSPLHTWLRASEVRELDLHALP